MNKVCNNCVYADGCPEKRGAVCRHFIPCDPIDEQEFYDDLTEKIVERERYQFYEGWFDYIGEYE